MHRAIIIESDSAEALIKILQSVGVTASVAHAAVPAAVAPLALDQAATPARAEGASEVASVADAGVSMDASPESASTKKDKRAAKAKPARKRRGKGKGRRKPKPDATARLRGELLALLADAGDAGLTSHEIIERYNAGGKVFGGTPRQVGAVLRNVGDVAREPKTNRWHLV